MMRWSRSPERAMATITVESVVRARGRPNSDTGGEFYPLLTRPVAVPRIGSRGLGPIPFVLAQPASL